MVRHQVIMQCALFIGFVFIGIPMKCSMIGQQKNQSNCWRGTFPLFEKKLLSKGALWSDEPFEEDVLDKNSLKPKSEQLFPVPTKASFKDSHGNQIERKFCARLRTELIKILSHKIVNPKFEYFNSDLCTVRRIIKNYRTGEEFLLFSYAKVLIAENVHQVESSFTDGSQMVLTFNSTDSLWYVELQKKL